MNPFKSKHPSLTKHSITFKLFKSEIDLKQKYQGFQNTNNKLKTRFFPKSRFINYLNLKAELKYKV